MYFKNFHRAWWSRKLSEALGALEKRLRRAFLITPGPALRVLGRMRQDSAAEDWGGSPNPSWRSLALGPAHPHLSPSGQPRQLSPGTAAPAAAALEVYFRHVAAPTALLPLPWLHPASLLGFGPFPPKSTAECSEAPSPAERNNLNLLRGHFPLQSPQA